MSNLTPSSGRHVSAVATNGSSRAQRRLTRDLEAVEHHTLVGMAEVRGTGLIQGEKLEEIDHLTRTAMSGQAMLSRWSATLAQGDPFLADELRFFTDVARMGKAQVIADTITAFSRRAC